MLKVTKPMRKTSRGIGDTEWIDESKAGICEEGGEQHTDIYAIMYISIDRIESDIAAMEGE